MEKLRRDTERQEYWKSCSTKDLSDEDLAKLLKPSFDLRLKPPVEKLGTLKDRVWYIMDWGNKLEEDTYYRLLEEYSYDEKLDAYYYTGTPPDRHRHSFVCGPRKWKGKKKDEKRVITEEMRTWQPTNLEGKKDEKRIIITEEMMTWQPTNLEGHIQESDSLWFSSAAALGPIGSHSDGLRIKKQVTFDMDFQCIGDEGTVDRLEERTCAANDVRNPHYNPQPAMPVSASRSEPLTPGILPKGFF